MSTAALPGFRDFYPEELAQREHIVRAWRAVARRYAFQEYDGPPLESLELYTRKSGDEIVDQLYAFKDKGGRDVAMRPEMTPTFARMVAARASALRKPVRWFSVPQLFRYERKQKGRLREHFQLNADIVGESDVTADAEILALALDVMRELGLSAEHVRARVSDRRLLVALLEAEGVGAAAHDAVFGVLDKLERQAAELSRRKLEDAGVSAAQATHLLELVRVTDISTLRARYPASAAVADRCDALERYLALLDALGVREWVSLDLSIVRGLAYYTGIVFELFDTRGEFRAICGGGRYDSLLASLGGVELPSVGFGMGDVVLGELLKARELMPALSSTVDYWVASWDGTPAPDALRLARRLREKGRGVEYALRTQSPGRQLKAAIAAGARVMVVRQPDGRVRVRRLGDGRTEDEQGEAEFIETA